MPRIPDILINSTIYLYPSKQAALQGERAGGSGFFLLHSHILRIDKELAHLYAVTNSHVIRRIMGNSPIIRYNTTQDDIEIIELDESHWFHHPDGDDIAICPIDQRIISSNIYDIQTKKGIAFVTREALLTHEDLNKLNIGPGDDVFTIGRFVNHEGEQRNLPTVRFGTIAQMPEEPIRLETGLRQEGFLIESKSISGYSGSPVFIHIPAYTNRWDGKGLNDQYYTRLLGINCGHLPFYEKVVDKEGNQVEDYQVKGNSGMAVVIPAWKLEDLLALKELVLKRQQTEQEFLERDD